MARVIMNIISTFIAFTTIKYFPLTYSASARNISPFFAMLLSCLYLQEAANLKEISVLTLVVVLILGFVFAGDTAN